MRVNSFNQVGGRVISGSISNGVANIREVGHCDRWLDACIMAGKQPQKDGVVYKVFPDNIKMEDIKRTLTNLLHKMRG